MIALLQRVARARVEVGGECVGAIGAGTLALAGFHAGDDPARIPRLAERILGLRMFADGDGRMNRALAEAGGGLLLVPQFTLAADTTRGARPSFDAAAPAAEARVLFEALRAACSARHPEVRSGRFGADMRVELVNDGPVTFALEMPPPRAVE